MKNKEQKINFSPFILFILYFRSLDYLSIYLSIYLSLYNFVGLRRFLSFLFIHSR
jgi:hypothetical protein